MTAAIETTASLCPECLALIPARLVPHGDEVFLEKRCPDHGAFQTPVWRGEPAFESWRCPRRTEPTGQPRAPAGRGCPFACGLCPDHRQRTCTLILEVTRRCNLDCPVCYAGAGGALPDPDQATVAASFERAWHLTGGCNIQLSGGEPTLRDDLPALVETGRRQGFDFIQINTNGLRLAREPDFVRALRDAGLASVFLQFDGTRDDIYRALRGRALLDEKRAAMDACAEAGIGVVLVPTLVPGVNGADLGAILHEALARFPAVRAVHFQPVSYFGRYPAPPAAARRLTLPEVMRAIESQSGGLFHCADFKPPGCENPRCSFHARYLIGAGGRPRAWEAAFPAAAPETAGEGAARAIAFVARQWAAAPPARPASPSGKAQPAACRCGDQSPRDLDAFLGQVRAATFSVSAMAFQEAWNLDLQRVRDCCIHVLSPEGGRIPFCLYNLTSVQGRRLYRE